MSGGLRVARSFRRLAFVALGMALAPGLTEARPAGMIRLSCWEFDRGNARVCRNPALYGDYRDTYPGLMLTDRGEFPWFVEFDVVFPVATTYTLRVRYASPAQRPLEVWVDDRRVGTCCRDETRNPPPYLDRHPPVHEGLPERIWDLSGAKWEEGCKFEVTEGKHTLKFTRDGPPANLVEIRLESPVPFPKGYKPPVREVEIERIPVLYRRAFLPPGAVNTAALRLAIRHNIGTFGSAYRGGPGFLKELEALEAKQEAARDAPAEEKEAIEQALADLRRRALFAHPALNFDKLLFVAKLARGTSIYTRHRSTGAPGGNLCLLSPVAPDGKVTELVPELSGGVFGRFDVSYDATRVVFAYAKEGGRFRIYEIEIDPNTGLRVPGKPLRQLTFDTPDEAETIERYKGSCYGQGFDDIDPCYLPNGEIMFASTRSKRAVLCFPMTSTTLHVMDPDGKNIRCISGGQVNEMSPCVLDDGRVVYTRWEYVDKGFGNAQSLWLVRPDGSGSDHVYKNMVVRPAGMIHTRPMPFSTRIVTIGVGHHGLPGGPVIVVDNRWTRRTADAMTNLTPEISYPGLYPMTRKFGYFKDPFPLTENFYLVSHNPTANNGAPAGFGIYVFDAWGNRAELYRHPKYSCYEPFPLRPRPRPTIIPPVEPTSDTARQGLATLYVHDVYQGLTGIERGRVKYIRVMEAMNLSWYDAWRAGKQGDGAGLQASVVSAGCDVAIKKIHGIARVYEDGSASFTVPASKNVFFQALDENFMELQRMRTFINLMPGEQRSCIGCHEFRRKAPDIKPRLPMALAYPAQPLFFQPGDTGPRTVHYPRDVQPILDKHCVKCHSGENPKGDLDLTGELTAKFNRSYENLIKKKLVSRLEGGFGSANVPAEPPLTLGSHRSKLVERIRKPPCNSGLTREEFIRIVTWIDANVPYYGTHRGKKDIRWRNEPDFRPMPLPDKLARRPGR